MILRVENLLDNAGRTRPYLVDAERDEVLPCQLACRIESDLDGGCLVTVTFAVDDRSVVIRQTIQDEPGKPAGE